MCCSKQSIIRFFLEGVGPGAIELVCLVFSCLFSGEVWEKFMCVVTAFCGLDACNTYVFCLVFMLRLLNKRLNNFVVIAIAIIAILRSVICEMIQILKFYFC